MKLRPGNLGSTIQVFSLLHPLGGPGPYFFPSGARQRFDPLGHARALGDLLGEKVPADEFIDGIHSEL